MAKSTHYGATAQRARARAAKPAFPHCFTTLNIRAKCQKLPKLPNTGGVPDGYLDNQVSSLRDKHECGENRTRWRMKCRLGITKR